MLDPWTALSLASAVVQFVDFGRKVFSTIAGNSRIIVNGLSRADIELLARDLAEVGQKLKHPLTSAEALTGHDASSEAVTNLSHPSVLSSLTRTESRRTCARM